jgi:hypothetical protein
MATLHGSWLVQPQRSFLFIWGETWRPMSPETQNVELLQVDSVLSHPMAMTQEELISFLRSRNLGVDKLVQGEHRENTRNGEGRWLKEKVALPTRILETGQLAVPELSTKVFQEDASNESYLQPWQVEGICLEPLEAVKFLQALPLSSFNATDDYVGTDLRFWSHIARWSLDLLARCKFLPTLHPFQSESVMTAHWQPLLDSAIDQERICISASEALLKFCTNLKY